MDAGTRIKTHHNPEENRFELRDGDAVIGLAEYLTTADGTQRIFFHTEVDDAYAGQGLAGRLAEAALSESVGDGWRIVPICSFVAGYVRKHQEYAGRVDEPTKEHRAAVRAVSGDS